MADNKVEVLFTTADTFEQRIKIKLVRLIEIVAKTYPKLNEKSITFYGIAQDRGAVTGEFEAFGHTESRTSKYAFDTDSWKKEWYFGLPHYYRTGRATGTETFHIETGLVYALVKKLGATKLDLEAYTKAVFSTKKKDVAKSVSKHVDTPTTGSTDRKRYYFDKVTVLKPDEL